LLPGPPKQTKVVYNTVKMRPELVEVDNPLPDGKEQQYLSPQLGMSCQLFSETVIHSALGRGIRIPVLGERFLQFKQPLLFLPNPKLVAEQSFSFELGLRQRFGNQARLETTVFYSIYRDLIEPVIKPDLTGTLVNIPRARIQGIETSGRFQFWRERLRLEATATWTDPVITQTSLVEDFLFQKGQLLSYRPRLLAYLSPSLSFGPFSLEADYTFASKLRREQVQLYKDDQRVPQKQLDMRLLYRWQGLTAQFAVRNVLHYTYALVERNVNEVRNFAIGMMWEN
jgi:outer membrane receptor protein involved in Fe transport